MEMCPVHTKSHPLRALWEDEQSQGQANGRTDRALLIDPDKSHSSSQPIRPAASALFPEFGQDQELSLTPALPEIP